jgi:hypothetical protein
MVCCNARQSWDVGLIPQAAHCRMTETAVARQARMSNAPETNQALSSAVTRRTSRAGSMVMTLPGTNGAVVRVAAAVFS